MVKNMSSADRLFRLLLAMAFVFVVAMGFIQGGMAWLLGILAFALFVTAAVGSCPLYRMIGIDSHVHDGTEHYGG